MCQVRRLAHTRTTTIQFFLGLYFFCFIAATRSSRLSPASMVYEPSQKNSAIFLYSVRQVAVVQSRLSEAAPLPAKLSSCVELEAEAGAPTIDKVSDTVQTVVDKVSSRASQAKTMMHEKTSQMTDPDNKVLAATFLRIRENPVTAVAIAAVAGYILGRNRCR
jgi:ElaB/YqjD/DUF883 family membrane-anchored ribosome-binding protein